MTDCCFTSGDKWFRYRAAAIIVSENYALFATDENEKCGYYYTVGGGVHIGETAQEAVLREIREEVGEGFVVERPLCLVENFFNGDGLTEGLECHTIEIYYLVKPTEKREFNTDGLIQGGDVDKLRWLPIDKIDEFDVRPEIVKEIIRDLPEKFTFYINDGGKKK